MVAQACEDYGSIGIVMTMGSAAYRTWRGKDHVREKKKQSTARMSVPTREQTSARTNQEQAKEQIIETLNKRTTE